MNHRTYSYDKENEIEFSEHLRFSMSAMGRRSSHQDNEDLKKGGEKRRGTSSSHDSNKLCKHVHNNASKQQRTSHGSDSLRYSSETSKRNSRSNKHSTSLRQNHQLRASKEVSENDNVVAVFGGYGVTGHHFLKLALEAGYNVRAMMLPGISLDDMQDNENLKIFVGTLDDEDKVKRVVRNAAYVVCMLTDCENTLQETEQTEKSSKESNLNFMQLLCPILTEIGKCKVLLYQSSSFASDDKGSAPLLSQVRKKVAVRKSAREFFNEQDKIVQYISEQQKQSKEMSFIVTRPGSLIIDRPSKKKLLASKSQPGPFPITNVDLAEFSLNALKTKKLYNSCPYVVQDGI